jgi:hypothetical protein
MADTLGGFPVHPAPQSAGNVRRRLAALSSLGHPVPVPADPGCPPSSPWRTLTTGSNTSKGRTAYHLADPIRIP